MKGYREMVEPVEAVERDSRGAEAARSSEVRSSCRGAKEISEQQLLASY